MEVIKFQNKHWEVYYNNILIFKSKRLRNVEIFLKTIGK